jgi:large conductance mechanosensitive channel
MIKSMNRMKRKKEAPVVAEEPKYSISEKLLMEIRDSVKKGTGVM